MKIRHVRPFGTDGNIGKEYNQVISEMPDDCYICLTDGDVLFLTPDWGNQIEAIIKANPNYDLITCMTNRIGLTDLIAVGMDHSDISRHIDCATFHWQSFNTAVKPTPVGPGMLMIFHKSLWHKHKFVEKSIIFDRQFSDAVIKGGGKIGVAMGLYVFHLYRWGSKSPKTDIKHLLWKSK